MSSAANCLWHIKELLAGEKLLGETKAVFIPKLMPKGLQLVTMRLIIKCLLGKRWGKSDLNIKNWDPFSAFLASPIFIG